MAHTQPISNLYDDISSLLTHPHCLFQICVISIGQLSPNSAALGLANQKSPIPDIKPDPAGITAAMTKEDLMSASAKMLLKQLSQEPLPQQPQKPVPGAIGLPSTTESASEELTIHPGGSGETSNDIITDHVTIKTKLLS